MVTAMIILIIIMTIFSDVCIKLTYQIYQLSMIIIGHEYQNNMNHHDPTCHLIEVFLLLLLQSFACILYIDIHSHTIRFRIGSDV